MNADQEMYLKAILLRCRIEPEIYSLEEAMKDLNTIIDSLPSETAKGQWIDVKTALPEENRKVWVTDGKKVSISSRFYDGFSKKIDWFYPLDSDMTGEVIMWMEIVPPAPPITGKETEK